jgi:hypothetical protein
VSSIKTCTATFTAVWGGSGTEPSGCLAAPAVIYPASAGPIGSSISQYTGATQYPDLAYDKCQQVYLAVWSLGGTIRGRFISEDGVGVGDTFYVTTGQYAQAPKVIYNPNLGNFLVAWHSSVTDNRTEVRSAIVSYPPGPAAAGTVLSASTFSSRWITRPAIGYSTGSGQYFVAWSRYATNDAEINARLVDTLGAAVGGEIPVTSSTSEYDREPTVGYFPGTNRFLLAWAGTGTSVDFVRGQLYNASTGATYGSPIALGQNTYTYVPEAVLNTASGNMFVVWIQNDSASGGWRPFGRFVNGDGALLTATTRLSATEGSYDANSIDYNPLSRTFFLVTHGSSTAQDVGFEIGGDGTPLGTAATVTSITLTGLTGSFNPRLAASKHQPRWLIGTAASFSSLWTQLIGGGTPTPIYQLNVTAPSHGTVTGSGINCGTGGSACFAIFETSSSVTLTATPDTGYRFSSWGGNCSGTSTTATVTVDGVKTCTAAFSPSVAGVGSDFTNDLKADILWRHVTNGQIWLWPMDGTARTSETFVRTVADTDWEVRAVGDFTGDRSADIMWRNKTTGMVYLWPMNGTTPASETYVGTVDTAYDIVSSGDYDGDGKADLLWRNLSSGDVWVWLMNGATVTQASFLGTAATGYVVKGSGDLNADGRCDIVWHRATTGEVWVWLSNGTTSPDQVYVGTVPDTGYQIAQVIDFSGDGKADILWRHATNGDVWIWLMNGASRTSESWVGTVADTNYRIVSAGDYNGDLKADILWWNSSSGDVWIWLMNGTTRTSEAWVATVPDTGYHIVK